MNIQESLKNLSIKMQQKNFLFVTNNIHEIFIDKETREISTIIDKIYDIATKKLKHKQVIYFAFGQGLKVLGDSNPKFTDETLSNFRDHIKRDIEDINENKQHSTYVIDFGDFILDQDSKGGEPFNIILEIIALILTSQNKNSSQLSNNKLQSKMIFVMRDAGHILNYITNKNVEYAEVLISKPDRSERQKLFNQVASRFLVNNSEELRQKDSSVQIEAVALTDGMSNREILQLSRISSTDEDLSFKELYYLSTLKTKSSSWEQLKLQEILNFSDFLKKRVFGQEYAISRVTKTLKRALMGLTGAFQGTNSNKPKGILFFCGPTGVGKTEMAKAITKFIFEDQRRMVRFDMSEFAQEHSDQRLLGAPPGFIGFDGGGELTNKVKESPNSLLLFDEVEKAHPRILDKFLQILEDGRLTSAKGELINFAETFIIFTSNIGSAEAIASQTKDSEDNIRSIFVEAVCKHFEGTNQQKGQLGRPEILNRIGRENIIAFNFIRDKKVKIKMLQNKLSKFKEVVEKKHHLLINFNNDTVKDLVGVIESDAAYKEKDGARGIIEIATKLVVDELVDYLIKYKIDLKNKIKPDAPQEIEMIVQREKVKFLF